MKRNFWVLSVLNLTRQALLSLAMWDKIQTSFKSPANATPYVLVGHYFSPSFLHFFLVAVVTTPATAARVSIVVTETATVVTVGRGLVSLAGCALVAESTESTVLGVQLRVATEGLLALLALKRGKTTLCLGLSGDAVGSGSGAVLGEGGAGTAGLRGFKALGLIGGNGGLSGNRRILAEATLGAAEDIRHSGAERVGTGGRLVVRLLSRAGAAID